MDTRQQSGSLSGNIGICSGVIVKDKKQAWRPCPASDDPTCRERLRLAHASGEVLNEMPTGRSTTLEEHLEKTPSKVDLKVDEGGEGDERGTSESKLVCESAGGRVRGSASRERWARAEWETVGR